MYDDLVIVDTGSRDRTVEAARACGARVLSFPWRDDFSAARNHALDHATGEWVLWLDADDEVVPEDRGKIRPLLADPACAGYFFYTLSLVHPGVPSVHVRNVHLRLFRRTAEHRFVGAIHEYVTTGAGRYGTAGVRILHHGYLPGELAAKDKTGRNLRILRRLVEDEPGNALWHYYLGCELCRAGDWTGAAASFGRAREVLGESAGWAPDLWRRSAICRMHLGQHREALAELQEGIARHPDYTDLHFLLGLLWHRLARYGDALAALRRALEMGEPPPWYTHDHGTGGFRALTALAQVHYDLGNYPEAAHACLEALRRQPDYPGPLPVLVGALWAMHPPRKASALLAAFVRDLRLAPAPRVALCTRVAAALHEVGAHAACLEWLGAHPRRSRHDGAGPPEAVALRARALAALGRSLVRPRTPPPAPGLPAALVRRAGRLRAAALAVLDRSGSPVLRALARAAGRRRPGPLRVWSGG